eukprot:94207_1
MAMIVIQDAEDTSTYAYKNPISNQSTEQHLNTTITTTSLEKQQTNPLVFKRAHTVMLTEEMQWFDEHYVKQEPLGEPGTFGMAFRCYKRGDPNKRNYAVKQINKAKFYFKETQEVLQNMKNEIEVMRLLSSHAHIVTLFETYEDRNYIYFILDCLSGGELFARIDELGSLSEAYAASISHQIFSAIQFMQQHNVAHLDLKPDNILFVSEAPDSPIKLIDFGEARFVRKGEKLSDKIGTPFYMSPAVIAGEYDPFAADIWSCGVIIFCMLCGYVPFFEGGDDEAAIFALITKGFTAEVREGYGAWFAKDIAISAEAMKLIAGLLTSDDEQRLKVDACLDDEWVNGKSTPPVVPHHEKQKPKQRTQTQSVIPWTESEDFVLVSSPHTREGIVKKGYLLKEGKLFKSWKKRYFTLSNTGMVSYYALRSDEEPISQFSIRNCIKIIKSKKISHGLIICTLERNWRFVCANDKTRDAWIAALQRVNKECNKMNIRNAMGRSPCLDWKETVLVNGYVRELQNEYQIKLNNALHVINIISLLYYGYNADDKVLKTSTFEAYLTKPAMGAYDAVKNYKFGDLTRGFFKKMSRKAV